MSIIKREGLPHFVVKKNLQKSGTRGIYFSDVVTEEVLRDVCLKITGQMEFTCEYVETVCRQQLSRSVFGCHL